MRLKIEKAVLVYQAGLANVFEVDCFNLAPSGRTERRLLQSDFGSCEQFARGLERAGTIVRTAACNMAGDIARQLWTEDLESQPFSDKFNPINPDSNLTRQIWDVKWKGPAINEQSFESWWRELQLLAASRCQSFLLSDNKEDHRDSWEMGQTPEGELLDQLQAAQDSQ